MASKPGKSELAPDRSGIVPLDGHRIHWERFGKGEKEPVCLLNGLAMHCKAWYGLLPFVLPHHDVVLYDYLGQGESDAPDEPYLIPRFAHALAGVADLLGIGRLHVMGISYGGFVALDFARLHPGRLRTLTVSGALLSHEELFSMYQELSLLFYRSGPEAFEIYTHYMYEKIFGETFVRTMKPSLETMRQKFHARYKNATHALIRLTEAQNPFFAALDQNLPAYRAIATPTLILAGAEDRTIPPWVQRKLRDVLPNSRFELVPDSGHVVYLEKPELFFGTLARFTAARTTDFGVL